MKNNKKCKTCGSTTHYTAFCFQTRKKQIRQQTTKAKFNWNQTVAQWKLANPPDDDGFWYCYLQISPMCLRRLDASTLTLDHVKPRSSHPDLKHDYKNLRPACSFCNLQKGSRSLESIQPDSVLN